MKDADARKRFFLILILGLLIAIGHFSLNMYLPAFPAIAQNLHSTVAQVMLSLSSFSVGISVGQLLYGPLLERFGRKKPLYAGLCIYLVASIGCGMAAAVNFIFQTGRKIIVKQAGQDTVAEEDVALISKL